MEHHPVRPMSTSGTALPPRPFRVRQHDIDVFYALVGGARSAATSKEEPEKPADAAAELIPEPRSRQTVPATQATPAPVHRRRTRR